MHLSGRSFHNHLQGDFWIVFILLLIKRILYCVLQENFKNAKKLTLYSFIYLWVALGEYTFFKNQLQIKRYSYTSADIWYSLPHIHNYLFFAIRSQIEFLSTEAENLLKEEAEGCHRLLDLFFCILFC